MSTTTQRIRAKLDQLPPGQPVGYADFVRDPAEFGAVAAALSRLSKSGELTRLAKGRYYRPARGRFGPVTPTQAAVVAAVGAAPGQPPAYPTGLAVYNALGLTTQVPATLTLATTRPRRRLPARLRAVVRPAPELASDVPLLQWLEVLRDVRRIPDTTPGRVVVRVADYLRQLPAPARRRLTALAVRQSPPRVRALLGALLETLPDAAGAAGLRATLNPLTTYRLGLSAAALPNRAVWNIR